MDLQVVLPNESPGMAPETLVELAVAAERLGYTTAWLPDHVLPPEPYGPTFGGVYEPLVTIAHLAARTSRLRFGTSVLVLPLRSPFVVAKQAATLHHLTSHRFVLGVGVGWQREEFTAVGADYRDRGRSTDEALALISHLFDGGTSFAGERFGFERGVFEPLPGRPVPLMVGGSSERALRRAARFADEWQGVSPDPEEFSATVSRLRALTGRTIRVGTRLSWTGGNAGLERTLGQIDALEAAGADAVAVHLGELPGHRDRMAALVAAVRDRR